MARWVVRQGRDLGAAIAEIRRQRGLTQEDLAETVGLDRTYLARLEAGSSVQLLDRAMLLLRRLGADVTVSWTDEAISHVQSSPSAVPAPAIRMPE
jgi:transcriptional regulator with XRE-family HTH domain